MTLTKIATLTIDEKEAKLILDGLLDRISKLTSCTCEDFQIKTIKERAKEVLDIYYFAYDISKVPNNSLIKVPSLKEIEERIEKK